MNWYLLIANTLTFLAFIAHTFIGDKEILMIFPDMVTDKNHEKQEKWTMARAGWHWLSFDLLMISVGMAIINFSEIIPDEKLVLKIIAIYLFGNAFLWLITITISKPFPKNYLKLGQWILLIVIGGLTVLAAL